MIFMCISIITRSQGIWDFPIWLAHLIPRYWIPIVWRISYSRAFWVCTLHRWRSSANIHTYIYAYICTVSIGVKEPGKRWCGEEKRAWKTSDKKAKRRRRRCQPDMAYTQRCTRVYRCMRVCVVVVRQYLCAGAAAGCLLLLCTTG